ncbi:hypothetical protein HZS_5748 [Henneguya salminicola]|nr:hypothetical protein HZS_5748 [Henneguya salminicola]
MQMPRLNGRKVKYKKIKSSCELEIRAIETRLASNELDFDRLIVTSPNSSVKSLISRLLSSILNVFATPESLENVYYRTRNFCNKKKKIRT